MTASRYLPKLILFFSLVTPAVFAKAHLAVLLERGDTAFGKRNQKEALKRALSFYKEAQSRFPQSSEAAWKYSMALHSLATRFTEEEATRQSLFHQGVEIAKTAATREPDCGPCQFWTAIHMAQYGELAGIFKMISTLSEIKERLEQAALLSPEHAMGGPYRVLGTIYQSLPGILGGDNDKAISYFQKAVAIVPNEAINYLPLAKLKAIEGDLTSAWNIAKAGLQMKDSAKDPISLESKETLPELSQIITTMVAEN
ncbi:MAG: hypothetical protein EB078_01765 [Proteobacteria bacterium]|nr:hypothetical protein [Pseudomonadota bacterium]NDC23438.1 hypothetical protein [Pseudomonadota bacterium]NDD03608.1 hypothetical protein [Pseudomonadota bacterium]NDG25981.1 hypothetical protein [Pseudomonadota bacterium]